MRRNYKLAANFNTVELVDITNEDLMEMLDWDNEVGYDQNDEAVWDVTNDELLARLLQKEYDILAGIKVVPPQPTVASTTSAKSKKKKAEGPSEKQIAWAKNLGMKNADKATRREVWQYIQDHKDDYYDDDEEDD